MKRKKLLFENLESYAGKDPNCPKLIRNCLAARLKIIARKPKPVTLRLYLIIHSATVLIKWSMSMNSWQLMILSLSIKIIKSKLKLVWNVSLFTSVHARDRSKSSKRLQVAECKLIEIVWLLLLKLSLNWINNESWALCTRVEPLKKEKKLHHCFHSRWKFRLQNRARKYRSEHQNAFKSGNSGTPRFDPSWQNFLRKCNKRFLIASTARNCLYLRLIHRWPKNPAVSKISLLIETNFWPPVSAILLRLALGKLRLLTLSRRTHAASMPIKLSSLEKRH